jgi:hypothetical protein
MSATLRVSVSGLRESWWRSARTSFIPATRF